MRRPIRTPIENTGPGISKGATAAAEGVGTTEKKFGRRRELQRYCPSPRYRSRFVKLNIPVCLACEESTSGKSRASITFGNPVTTSDQSLIQVPSTEFLRQ